MIRVCQRVGVPFGNKIAKVKWKTSVAAICSMFGWPKQVMNEWMNEWIDEWTNGRMDEAMKWLNLRRCHCFLPTEQVCSLPKSADKIKEKQYCWCLASFVQCTRYCHVLLMPCSSHLNDPFVVCCAFLYYY